MRRIIVRLQGNHWTAEEFGPRRAEIINLFGTAIIPTPYMLPMTGPAVADELIKRNPDAQIVVEELVLMDTVVYNPPPELKPEQRERLQRKVREVFNRGTL